MGAWGYFWVRCEKIAMKKMKLMREDVTFATIPSQGLGYLGQSSLVYVLKDVLKKRVSDKIAGLVVYKDLIPVQLRKTKGGLDFTVLFKFKKEASYQPFDSHFGY